MAILVKSLNGKHILKASLSDAATDADCAGKTVVVTSPQTLTTALSWPSDRELTFDKGGYITFSGSGALTGLKEARPEWFGVNTTPGTTDMTTAIGKAAAASAYLIIDQDYAVSTLSLPLVHISGTGTIRQLSGNQTSPVMTLTASGSTVDDINIVGCYTAETRGTSVGAIYFTEKTDITIRNVSISGKQTGILGMSGTLGVDLNTEQSATKVSRILVENCNITYTLIGVNIVGQYNTSGTLPRTYPNDGFGSDITVRNCTLALEYAVSGLTSGQEVIGINIAQCDNWTVEGNRSVGGLLSIQGWRQSGYRQYKNAVIRNNTADQWITLNNATESAVIGNTVDYSLRPSSVATSTVYPTVPGIELIGSDTTTCSHNRISNIIGSGILGGNAGSQGPGDLSYDTHDLLITHNQIDNVGKSGSTAYAGMMLGGMRNSLIAHNVMTRCVSAGIYSGGTATNYNYKLTFSNNVVTGTQVDAATGAFYLVYSREILIDGHKSLDNVGLGAYLGAGGVNGLIVRNSTFSGNGTYGLKLDVGTENLFIGNDFRGNTTGAINETSGGELSVVVKLINNIGIKSAVITTPSRNTFRFGESWPIEDATKYLMVVTASGTMGTLTGVTATTTSGSAVITVNATGALKLVPGQYITIAGVTGTKLINKMVGTTVTLSTTADASVAGAAVAYSAATFTTK